MDKKLILSIAATAMAFNAHTTEYETITKPLVVKNNPGNANIIEARNTNFPSYNTVFRVTNSGRVEATGLLLRNDGNAPTHNGVDNSYNPQFNINRYNDGWSINTSNYPGHYKPLHFQALNYVFDVENTGTMEINCPVTCKQSFDVLSINASQIKADDIKVNMNNAADYVFGDDYSLQPLSEVEKYVKANRHLPGMPSATEFSENGMSVAEMSNKLLEKVEELTLHLIRLEKENALLKAKMEAMEK